jgi:periplasmic divalent cation tolerance protein
MSAGGKEGAALIWCPFPDRESARAVARALLEERLIACANIIGEIEALFVWQGTPGSGSETAVLFKTTAARLDAAVARLGKLHPYDTPAVAGWRCDAAHPETLAWLAATCSAGAEGAPTEDRDG